MFGHNSYIPMYNFLLKKWFRRVSNSSNDLKEFPTINEENLHENLLDCTSIL